MYLVQLVAGIYTKILHTFGLEAVRYFLVKYEERFHPKFNVPFILEPVDFTLKNKTCVFENEKFLQHQGTALSTLLPPTFANVSLG